MKCNTDSYKFDWPLVVCCWKALAHSALGHWVCYGPDKDVEWIEVQMRYTAQLVGWDY